MATIPEQISNMLANSQGKPDSNLAQDSNNLGGLPAEDFATKEYVKKYHNEKEAKQKEYIDKQDTEMLKQAKEFANSLVRNQDFSGFAKLTDVQALDTKLSGELTSGLNNQKTYTDKEIEKVVNDTNENFEDVNRAMETLNGNMNNLFQSVSDGKSKIAGAITDKGVSTSASDTFDNMASNIRNIPTTGGEIPEGYVDTSSATASDSDLLLGKTAFAKGNKIIGSHVCRGLDTSDATATPYDILTGKTAYNSTGKIEGVLSIDESTGTPSYSIGGVQKVYGTRTNSIRYYSTNAEKQQGIQLTKNAVIRERYSNEGGYLGSYLFDIEDTNIVIAKRDNVNQKYTDVISYPLSDFGLKMPISDTETTEVCGIGVSNLNIEYPYMIIVTQYNVKNNPIYIKVYAIPLEITGEVGTTRNITVKKDQMTVSGDIAIGTTGNEYSGYKILNMNTTQEGDRFILFCTENIDYFGISTVALVFDISTTFKVTYIGVCGAGKGKFCNSITESFLIDKNTFVVGGYLNDHYIPVKSLGIINDSNQIINNELKGNVMAVSTDGKKILINDYDIEEITEDGISYSLYKYKYYIKEISIDYATGEIINKNIKAIPSGILPDTIKTYGNNKEFSPRGFFISENLFIYEIDSDSRDDMYKGLLFYNVNFDTTNVFSIFYRNPNKYLRGLSSIIKREPITNMEQRIYSINVNNNEAPMTLVDTFVADKDFSKVIALIYDGKYYYNNVYQSLTATPTDVREGQTFIGFNGKIETGTMVVETTETGGATNE